MITSILTFGLKSVLCSAVFGAYYLLLLRNAPPAFFNRFYLLTATLLSLLLPFVRLEIPQSMVLPVPSIPLLPLSGKGGEEVLLTTASPSTFDWQWTFFAGYIIITLFFLLGLAVSALRLYFFSTKAQVVSGEGYLLIQTNDPRAPFSFLNRLFWPMHMQQDSPETNSILRHELAHIRQHHTLDKLAMQFMLALSWINPINWFFRKELWLQHEFLADKEAFDANDKEAFARMLLYSVSNASGSGVINPFFQSPVKRRLAMLGKSSTQIRLFLRSLLSIPVLLTVLVLLSAGKPPAATGLPSPRKIILVLDAAHGGTDAGGESIYGYVEKDITLALCKKLNALSGEYNVEVVNTRESDIARSLPQRVQTSNHTEEAIFLSIHVRKNKATGTRDTSFSFGLNPQGAQYDKSLLLASSIANRLKEQKLPVKVVDLSHVYVLRENSHPALVVECGDLDNADDMALLKDESRAEILCRNILSGIVDYSVRLNASQEHKR